jgi:hypothetical protein
VVPELETPAAKLKPIALMVGSLIVCAGVMPNRCWPQPHWKMATCAPSAADIESRKPRIDLRA